MPDNNFEFLIEEKNKGSGLASGQEAVITGMMQERSPMSVLPELMP